MKKIFFLLILISNGGLLRAQEAEEKTRQYIGVGVRSAIFHISELPIRMVPPNRIVLNVDPIKNARIEIHYGFYNNVREQAYSISASTFKVVKIKEKSSIFGIGLFGVYPIGNVRYIVGGRYSINKYALDDVDFDSFGSPYVFTNNGKIDILSAVIGGEYFFAKQFSLGAEFSFINMTDKYTPFDKTIPSVTSKTTVSESSLIFRFYPY